MGDLCGLRMDMILVNFHMLGMLLCVMDKVNMSFKGPDGMSAQVFQM